MKWIDARNNEILDKFCKEQLTRNIECIVNVYDPKIDPFNYDTGSLACDTSRYFYTCFALLDTVQRIWHLPDDEVVNCCKLTGDRKIVTHFLPLPVSLSYSYDDNKNIAFDLDVKWEK